MPFKKPNNKKNTTKKQQQKKKAHAKPTDDAASVEEIVTTETTVVLDAPLEEVETEKILSEEELAAIAAHEQYMWETYYKPQQEENLKRWQDAQIALLDDPEYWEDRIENLLRARQRYHKKAAWSPEVFYEVDSIDNEIRACEEMIDMLDGVKKEAPAGNPLLGGMDWWKDGLTDNTDGWVSSR